MKSTRSHRLLLLVALLHLFADVALAGGAVLCVGPNDHTAIERGALASGCAAISDADADKAGALVVPQLATECTDNPLHSDAELSSKRLSWELDTPPTFVRPPPVVDTDARRSERPVSGRIAPSETIQAHRTIVLII